MASFRKRNGSWEYRIRYKDIYTGEKREKSKSGFRRQADAKAAADKVQISIADGYVENDANPPLEKFMWHWYSLVESSYRPNTKIHRMQSINRISKKLGRVPLKLINYDIVQRYLTEMANSDYSHELIVGDNSVIRMALTQAVREKYFESYPIEGIKIPKTKLPKQARFWSLDDLDKFVQLQNRKINDAKKRSSKFQYYKAIRDLAIFCTLAGCGCRISELIACYTDSYDPLSQTLKLHFNMSPIVEGRNAHNKFERTSIMKTESSYREVPVPEVTENALNRWLSVRSDYVHANRETDDNSLFPSVRKNAPMNKVSVNKILNEVCYEFELPIINVHGFRHTYASFLQQSGVLPKQAQVLLGHGDIRTTLNIYTHVSMESKRSAVSLLNDLLNKGIDTKNPHPEE